MDPQYKPVRVVASEDITRYDKEELNVSAAIKRLKAEVATLENQLIHVRETKRAMEREFTEHEFSDETIVYTSKNKLCKEGLQFVVKDKEVFPTYAALFVNPLELSDGTYVTRNLDGCDNNAIQISMIGLAHATDYFRVMEVPMGEKLMCDFCGMDSYYIETLPSIRRDGLPVWYSGKPSNSDYINFGFVCSSCKKKAKGMVDDVDRSFHRLVDVRMRYARYLVHKFVLLAARKDAGSPFHEDNLPMGPFTDIWRFAFRTK